MVLGLDFDNTIIKYDELFHKVAFEKNLIPADLPKEKNTVRNYLREKNIENDYMFYDSDNENSKCETDYETDAYATDYVNL